MDRLGLFIITVWIVLASSTAGLHAMEEDAAGVPDAQSWYVSADTIEYDRAADEYLATGNVSISKEGRTLTADMVRLNQTSRQAWAEGNVRLLSGNDVLTGRKMQLDMETETGSISEGSLFFSENHLYLKGSQIHKTGPATYRISDASATTCDGDHPDWRITARDLEVTIEGYGFAKHSAFWIRKMPLLYSPYFVFPVKVKRQTGFLAPEFGISDRKGETYLQPLFWAINDSMDATFFAQYMARRGTRLGAEFRYVASEQARGTFMFDGYDDRQVDDGEGENSDQWGYTDDQYTRPNSDRYWFRAKMDQDLPLGVTAKLDLDVVSDQDYLKEFKGDYGGFDQTRDEFLDHFNRDIEDYNDPVRRNQLNLNRLWSGYTLNMDARWYDDVIKRRLGDDDDTLQTLPQIAFDGTKKRIYDLPLYFDLLSNYTYFYRQEGERGHRADLYPRVYYPMRLLDAVNVEPSAGLRQTAWHMEDPLVSRSDDETDFYRAIYDLKLDTSTDIYRVFAVDVAGSDGIRHGIRPRFVYEYIPEKEQDRYPEFDTLDRIDARNRITYSLTNTLVARRPRVSSDDDRTISSDYLHFLRLKLEQSFDIDRHKENLDRPFSDILAELDITPGNYLALDADALWRPYDNRFYGFNAGFRLWDGRGDQLNLHYRYTREEPADPDLGTLAVRGVKSVNVTGIWVVTPSWHLRGKYEYNFENQQLIEGGGGISYLSQCWGISVDYSVEEEEDETNRSISFMVHLVGLGSFGDR